MESRSRFTKSRWGEQSDSDWSSRYLSLAETKACGNGVLRIVRAPSRQSTHLACGERTVIHPEFLIGPREKWIGRILRPSEPVVHIIDFGNLPAVDTIGDDLPVHVEPELPCATIDHRSNRNHLRT